MGEKIFKGFLRCHHGFFWWRWNVRIGRLPWKIRLASLSCQTPEISWPGYSALLFLAIETLTIYLVDYFSKSAKEPQRNSFWYLLSRDHRNSLRRFPGLRFVAHWDLKALLDEFMQFRNIFDFPAGDKQDAKPSQSQWPWLIPAIFLKRSAHTTTLNESSLN